MLFDQLTPPAQLLCCATLPNNKWTSMLFSIIVFVCTIYDISFLWIGRFFLVLPANRYLIAITSFRLLEFSRPLPVQLPIKLFLFEQGVTKAVDRRPISDIWFGSISSKLFLWKWNGWRQKYLWYSQVSKHWSLCGSVIAHWLHVSEWISQWYDQQNTEKYKVDKMHMNLKRNFQINEWMRLCLTCKPVKDSRGLASRKGIV